LLGLLPAGFSCAKVGPWVDIALLAITAAALELLLARARLSPTDNLVLCLACCGGPQHRGI